VEVLASLRQRARCGWFFIQNPQLYSKSRASQALPSAGARGGPHRRVGDGPNQMPCRFDYMDMNELAQGCLSRSRFIQSGDAASCVVAALSRVRLYMCQSGGGGIVTKKLMWALMAWLCVLPAAAQTLGKSANPGGVVTRAAITARFERTVNRPWRKGSARAAQVDISWPSDADEYRSLDKNAVILISVVVADDKELPLRRVYTDIGGKITELRRLTAMRSLVDGKSVTARKIGKYREDSFYLAPAGPLMQNGFLKADLAVKRVAFNLYQLPGKAPAFIKADGYPMPSGRGPDAQALKAMLAREYRGFESLND
jgi:hypothetical protein